MPRLPRGRSLPRDAGATLAELLVVVMLLALIVGALYPLLYSGQQAQGYAGRRQELIQSGRVALDKLLRELRAAESFRTLTPGDISFTLNWGDGSDAAPTVEYALNGATHNLEYRWRADYDYRAQITVHAASTVTTPYAASVTFNHAALVLAGKSLASGDDVRVRYWNGSTMVELDRLVDPTSAWNSATTTVWFALQAPIASGKTDGNYYLYYGNLADANPPANGANIFLDYQDGTTLDGWTRRDANPGAYSTSAANGFIFQTAAGTGFRELTKNVPHGDVEIFWGFSSAVTDARDGLDAGVSARLADDGHGYRLTVGDQNNTRLRIDYWAGWSGGGGTIKSVVAPLVPGGRYFGRFYLVGSTLQAKFWAAGLPEPPGWTLAAIDGRRANGNHYGLLDGNKAPENHTHSTVIIRPRVPVDPTTTLGPETSGTRPDALVPLAGPFRSLAVACFDAKDLSIPCAPTTPVRTVQATLVVMDPTGQVPDLTLTGQAFRRSP
ncbi:MAG TPA: hypothetical protein VKV57_00355 [bacterium]|nr:hypothetical protein [bacterium]